MILSQRSLLNLYLICFLILFSSSAIKAQHTSARERICGKWENKEKTLRIQVYTEKQDFRAKIIWFSDTEGKPMSYWKDKRNPDPALRNRTILGMSILSGLKYNASSGTWEDGKVYDSKHGKVWNASAAINKNGLLKVRGYWHVKFIGRTMTFHRIK
ncbi:DUF2147 domain-containing protein [Mucilaginibacter lacusdianchii]|uniref:DUF2147 domain-containing protein n=1 Tax=Mucilaginibacter lacusdianchii TaxID=2684211 RepID=UPI00131D3C96|nr:DUF2147 domain-containing protein [Mucilaginibacter sp. JXJ CY 39]